VPLPPPQAHGVVGVASPSTPGFFGEAAAATPWCLTPLLSPRYKDALVHGGFNPSTMFSPIYVVSFVGRRGPLQFVAASSPFDEMTVGGEEEAAR
jgi:hypothetical protein